MLVYVNKEIANHTQFMINGWYKPSTHECFIVVLPTLKTLCIDNNKHDQHIPWWILATCQKDLLFSWLISKLCYHLLTQITWPTQIPSDIYCPCFFRAWLRLRRESVRSQKKCRWSFLFFNHSKKCRLDSHKKWEYRTIIRVQIRGEELCRWFW